MVMSPFRNAIRLGLAALFVILAVAEVAWTQASLPVSTPGNDPSVGVFAFVLVAVALAVMGIAVKRHDTKRKRDDDADGLAVALQGRMSDALLTEPSIAGLPIMPTVRVSPGAEPETVILLTGMVPAPRFREVALRLVTRVAARLAESYRIENRLVVHRRTSRRTACATL
jgi:hypothetical protein